jgi:lipopolysaccharide biosynthesis regulator YciM
MEFETWMLLGIPVFFGLGWIAARVDIKQILSESRTLPRAYFKGLNFLLNDQPDKAIDAFIDIVKLDPETADMHFALGNLFRRRGEIERAIRVHQNLLARPDLPLEQRPGQYELGMDYLKAGLLDRAEETFNGLVDELRRAGAPRAAGNLPARKGMDARHRCGARPAGIRAPARARRKSPSSIASWRRTRWCTCRPMKRRWRCWTRRCTADRNNVRATMLSGDAQLAQGDVEGALLPPGAASSSKACRTWRWWRRA